MTVRLAVATLVVTAVAAPAAAGGPVPNDAYRDLPQPAQDALERLDVATERLERVLQRVRSLWTLLVASGGDTTVHLNDTTVNLSNQSDVERALDTFYANNSTQNASNVTVDAFNDTATGREHSAIDTWAVDVSTRLLEQSSTIERILNGSTGPSGENSTVPVNNTTATNRSATVSNSSNSTNTTNGNSTGNMTAK